MPSVRLSKISSTTGMLYRASVESSAQFMWKLPSPAQLTTVSSGSAVFAPMAAPSPNPMVPSPPEVMKCRGLRKV